MNPETYIIIPVWNEGTVIKGVLKTVLSQYKNVICVDDGSTDNTTEEIRKTSAILVSHPINLGQGASLETGIQRGLWDKKAKYFVTFDADGQHDIADVAGMIEALREGEYDIILGSRFLDNKTEMPTSKKALLKTAVHFTNITSGLKLTDTHNGLRVFTRDVATNLKIRNADYSHASEIIDFVAKNKLRYKEVPITISYTEYSKSKGQSLYNSVNIVFDLFINNLRR